LFWDHRPTLFEFWDEEYNYVMTIDENGTTDLQGIKNKLNEIYFSSSNFVELKDHPDRWFTITGVIMDREHYPVFRDRITSIKEKYWKNGFFGYKSGVKRVVFHSKEIRKKIGPFNPHLINFDNFIMDLSEFIKNTECAIFSSSIDKMAHTMKYIYPYHVYKLCLEFILERYCRFLNTKNKTGIVLLESRGKREDKEILQFILGFLRTGNRYYSPDDLACIKGIYFNPKWQKSSNGKLSYPLLELADLVSYPIHKYCRNKSKDKAFEIVERKLFNNPNYMGYGLKIFP